MLLAINKNHNDVKDLSEKTDHPLRGLSEERRYLKYSQVYQGNIEITKIINLDTMNYKIEVDKEIFELDDVQNFDAIQVSDSRFHILEDNQSYQVEIIESNFASKTITLEVNGNKYDVQINDSYDQLVKKLGFASKGNQKLKNIKAPMPGLILDILVEEGQTIQKGDQLIILEAMKMENILKAEGEGVIKSIEVVKSNAVDKGQVLIEMK